MLKLVACVFLILGFSLIVHATPQQPDILIYQNKSYGLYSAPLESYYKDYVTRPAFKIKQDEDWISNNWRGYIATWEIKNDFLYLVKIDAWICTNEERLANKCRRAELKELFGEKYIDDRVLANWFSGELSISEGRRVDESSRYNPMREKETILTVEHGKVIKSTKVNHTVKKGSLFPSG